MSIAPSLSKKSISKLTAVCIGIILVLTAAVSAQQAAPPEQKYQMPADDLAAIIDAPFTPSISISPNNLWILFLNRPGYPSIEEVAQPELRLAGVRLNPDSYSPSRQYYYDRLSLKQWSENEPVKIEGLPQNPKIANVKWSPDGEKIAFTILENNQVELWIVEDLKKPVAHKLTGLVLNDVYGTAMVWMPDSKKLICKIVPPEKGNPPIKPSIPTGPIIQENTGKAAPAPTYADLLKNAYDEALFEYYLDAQLVMVDLDGKYNPIGESGIISNFDPSPDGLYILVSIIHRPFSYLVKAWNFPHRVEIWNTDGDVVRLVTDQPLAEDIPAVTGSVRTGPRNFEWRPDVDATLYWAEALDGGDPRNEAEYRDQIYTFKAPFKGNPIPLFTLSLRYDVIEWYSDDLAIISEWWWKTRKMQKWAFAPGNMRVKPDLIFDYSWEDRYNHPGTPVEYINERGKPLLLLAEDGKSIFLTGDGASPEGDRPFLDRFNLETHETERLWRSEAPYFEEVVRILDPEDLMIVTRRESVDEPPDYFIHELDKNKLIRVTDFPHPFPMMAGVQKELIRYKRSDSLDLTGTLYLPAGYTAEQGPLPTLMWAYPREYKSADAAGQVTDSPYRFVRVGWYSPVPWVLHGYAVLDRASMPIVGEGDEEPNDTFVEQLVADAAGAIDELVRRGVTDPERVAVGGHSYGAFMTANLLAHSDLFRAGIARTGAYNRTLTPFGFQNEDRTLWEAPEIYFAMSPFMHADKIHDPILLIHGTADNNSGTFPMQSERFYNALKGLGATARLVMLPSESHSYRARESIMHVLWETDRWLEKYVKNAAPRETGSTAVKSE